MTIAAPKDKFWRIISPGKACASQACYTVGAMEEKPKNPAAVALAKLRAASMTPEQRMKQARKAGLVGGAARARKLSKRKRKAIAKKAAEAR